MESFLDWGFFPSDLVSECRERLLRNTATHVIYLPPKYKRDAWNKIIEGCGKEEKEFLEKLAALSDLPNYRGDATTQAPEQVNILPTQQNANSPVIPQRMRTVEPSILIDKAPLPRPGASGAATEVLVL